MAFTQCAVESSHMLILNQCFGIELCGQCCYFQQMLSKANTQGEHSSSTCASKPDLGSSLMGTRATKQRMTKLKSNTPHCTTVQVLTPLLIMDFAVCFMIYHNSMNRTPLFLFQAVTNFRSSFHITFQTSSQFILYFLARLLSYFVIS